MTLTDNEAKDLVTLIRSSITDKDKTNLTILIVLLVSFLIFFLISNLLIPILLNRSQRKNDITKLKIERRLDFLDKLLKDLKIINSSLTILDQDNIFSAKKNIENIRKRIYVYSFLVPKKMANSITLLLDYFSKVLQNPYSRDTNKENELFEQIYTEYDNLK